MNAKRTRDGITILRIEPEEARDLIDKGSSRWISAVQLLAEILADLDEQSAREEEAREQGRAMIAQDAIDRIDESERKFQEAMQEREDR